MWVIVAFDWGTCITAGLRKVLMPSVAYMLSMREKGMLVTVCVYSGAVMMLNVNAVVTPDRWLQA